MGVNVKGLILKEQNIGENDKLVTVLTDSLGVLRAFVRGAKKLSSKSSRQRGFCAIPNCHFTKLRTAT